MHSTHYARLGPPGHTMRHDAALPFGEPQLQLSDRAPLLLSRADSEEDAHSATRTSSRADTMQTQQEERGRPDSGSVDNTNDIDGSPSRSSPAAQANGSDDKAMEKRVAVSDVDAESGADAEPEYNHCGHKLLPGPPSVRNILGSELCERFSWYGLRAILVLYFHEHLGWSKSSSISIFSYVGALAYFMPLLGGWVSDALWGKYPTILRFSCIYVTGCALLSVAASQSLVWLSIVGLMGIAIGTGGIKPCVSSFGADQFTQRPVKGPHELAAREHAISSFFHFFYFSINLGSVGSFIVTPLLRQHFGYPVAFGVPAILLAIATLIFWAARHQYFRGAPAGSVLSQLAHTFSVAWKKRGEPLPAAAVSSSAASARAPHNWLDRALADPSVSAVEVENAKSLWRVLPIFAVLPVFWMLFNQQSSSWTLQADEMHLHGLQPEQIGVVNPVMIMLLLPLFDRVLYPLVARCGIDFTPLRRMGVGMLVSVLAFLLSAGVQYKISGSDAKSISVFWQLPQIGLISIAEILISVTGLEFAYTQAAVQLKSCVAALFLITSAIGDLLTGVLFQALSRSLTSTTMLLFFAALMLLNFGVFLAVAARYRPVLVLDDKVRAREEEMDDDQLAANGDRPRDARVSSAEWPSADEVDGHGAMPVPMSDVELSIVPEHPSQQDELERRQHHGHHTKAASSTACLADNHNDDV